MKTIAAFAGCLFVCLTSIANSQAVPCARVLEALYLPGVLESMPTTFYVVAPYNGDDRVTIDASCSYDPDGDPFEFFWSRTGDDGQPRSFDHNEQVIQRELDSNSILLDLYVSDGSGWTYLTFRVAALGPRNLVTTLHSAIANDTNLHPNKRVLLAALASAEKVLQNAEFSYRLLNAGEFARTIRDLRRFQMRLQSVHIGLSPTQIDSMLVASELAIEALHEGTSDGQIIHSRHNMVGAANRSQPIRSETNRTSSAAGSRR